LSDETVIATHVFENNFAVSLWMNILFHSIEKFVI